MWGAGRTKKLTCPARSAGYSPQKAYGRPGSGSAPGRAAHAAGRPISLSVTRRASPVRGVLLLVRPGTGESRCRYAGSPPRCFFTALRKDVVKTTGLRRRIFQGHRLADLSLRTQEAYLRVVRQLADPFHTGLTGSAFSKSVVLLHRKGSQVRHRRQADPFIRAGSRIARTGPIHLGRSDRRSLRYWPRNVASLLVLHGQFRPPDLA